MTMTKTNTKTIGREILTLGTGEAGREAAVMLALSDAELDHVMGGIGMLLPAVQIARDAATVPMETLSLNFER
jgi:hypothetical protein